MEDSADNVHDNVEKPPTPYEQLLGTLQEKKQILDEQLTSIEKKAQICKDCKHKCETTIQNYQPLIDAQAETRNGADQTLTQTARDLIQRAIDILKTQTDEFQRMIKEIECFYTTVLYKQLEDLISLLVKEVKHWQHELQLEYAELYAKVDLHSFAPCCAETGELLRDVLCTDVPRLENAVNAASVQVDVNLTHLDAQFRSLLTSFYHRTFVVVSQEGSPKRAAWNIKKGSGIASTPRITLRILGADTFEGMGGVPVHVRFVNENHINSYYDVNTDRLDTRELEAKGFKIKGEKMTKFVRQKNLALHEAVLSVDVQIPVNLKRAKDRRVHEEKYRLVFYTVLNDTEYWTLSLPLVLTTGGIQLCECLASVMWQCFSTNVFALPTEPLPVLPWSKLADMLQAKIRNISTRELTEGDLAHLRERLLSTSGSSEDSEISLHQFCSASLPSFGDDSQEEFSFWKWFLSIYNLIKTDLQDIWEKGWIEGFLSKEATERKLKSPYNHKQGYKQGLFLLRFSDGSLDSTQTKDSVFGKVATSVLVKSQKGHMEVTHVDRIGHDQLSKNSLLHILSVTKNRKGKNIYKYLYPNMENCENLLEGNVTKAPVVSGYLGVQNAYIADLEKIDDQLSKLDLRESTTTCPSSSMETDSDTDDDNDTVSHGLSEAKKLRTSLNNSSVLVSEVQDKGNGTYKSSVAADKSHGQAPRAMLPSANGTHILRQMLTNTNPTKQNDWHIFEIQDEKDIKASQTFGKVGLDKTGLSAQINLANATNCSHLSVIHGFDSEDSVSEIFTGSIAAAKPSGNMSLKPVSQNQTEVFQGTSESQARAQQNMSNVSSLQVIANNPNAICKEIQKPVSIENTNMVLSMTAQGQSDTTDQPHTKNIFKLQSEAGIGDTCKPASNLKTTYHMITSTSSCRLPVDEGHINITGYQHNSSRQMLAPTRDNDVSFDDGTVLGSYYGDKKMFGNQEFGPGLGEIIGVSNQLFKPAIDANQQAHNKVPTINSNPDSQILDTTSIGQNLMPTAHSNNSDQIFGPEKAANQTLISVDMSQYDLDTYESLNEVFGDIDEILKKSDISETISLSNKVQMQTETNPETTNTITDQLEDLLSDEEMMETVKSYLENCPHEKVMEILPKKMIMELIAPLFQQLTKSEYLTPLLENLPKDQKQRVIQALLCEKNNESQSLSDPSLPSIRPS